MPRALTTPGPRPFSTRFWRRRPRRLSERPLNTASTSVVAVVPAAGSGERLGGGLPKAFRELEGRTLVERAVTGLLESGVVDHVVVAVPADRVEHARQLLTERATVVAGGASRIESVGRALGALSDGAEAPDSSGSSGLANFVLVHDAARALTPPGLIVRVVEALRAGNSAVVPALRVSDTIKAVDANGVVLGTPERAGLRAVQTPQGFVSDLLFRAYLRAGAGSTGVTDDASMVEHFGGQVQVIEGDPLAFKITTPLDLLLAEAVLRA